jgi:hypothetical protein
MPGYAAISGLITGTTAGTLNIGPYTTPASTSAQVGSSLVLLLSGVNTVVIPAFAVGTIIVPDPTNTVGLTLKGVSGDTGIPLALTSACMFSFPPSPPANYLLVAALNFTTYTRIVFF